MKKLKTIEELRKYIHYRLGIIKIELDREKMRYNSTVSKYQTEEAMLYALMEHLDIPKVDITKPPKTKWSKEILNCLQTTNDKMSTEEIAKNLNSAYMDLSHEDKVKYKSKISFSLSKLRRAGKISPTSIEGKRGNYWHLNKDRWTL
jgi:C1A family cysteine protease